jgi:hypothetical protein
MGLDMYLKATRSLFGGEFGKSMKTDSLHRSIKDLLLSEDIDLHPESEMMTLKINIGYWRKANAIHAWFVKNVQGGKDEYQESPVERHQLLELKQACMTVLNSIETVESDVTAGTKFEAGKVVVLTEPGRKITNPLAAHEVLPTQQGFFFGGTEYDSYYISDLEDTIKILDRAIKLADEDWGITYRASW